VKNAVWPTISQRVLNIHLYIGQPEGYEDPDHLDKACLILESIYSPKQLTRAWWEDLSDCFNKIRQQQTSSDQALGFHHLLFILGHVDNILIVGNKSKLRKQRVRIHDRYKFKGLGPVSKYIGMMIDY